MKWFEYVKPRLAAVRIQRATVEYFRSEHPDIYAEALRIAKSMIAQSESIEIPDSIEYQGDGLHLVLTIVEDLQTM